MTPEKMMWDSGYWPRWWVFCAGKHCTWNEVMPRNATDKEAEARLAGHCGQKGHESGHVIQVGILPQAYGPIDEEKQAQFRELMAKPESVDVSPQEEVVEIDENGVVHDPHNLLKREHAEPASPSLEEAARELLKFARHKTSCSFPISAGACDCGLTIAAAKLRAALGEK